MVDNEANRETNRLKSPLERLNGKEHILTREDSIKGGQQTSDRKKIANSFKAITTGRFAKHIPHCNTCMFKEKCRSYDPKDPKAACKVIDIPNYVHLMSALTFTSEEEFDNFINKQMQRMYLKDLTTDDTKKMQDFLLIMLRVKETKYRSPKEQTINLQINNFSTEFQVFKDVTIRVLSRHPEVMQEWRAAIESAKQSN